MLDAAIGPVNKSFYRPKFDRFAAGQGSVSWNWPAFFVTIFWMLYRRMYAYALLVWLVLPIVFVIVAAIIGGISGDPGVYAGTYYLLWMVTGFVIIPMFANRLYYRHATNKIARARALFNNEEDQLREVYRTGGTGGAGIIVAVIFGGIMLVARRCTWYRMYRNTPTCPGLASARISPTSGYLRRVVTDKSVWLRAVSVN